MDIHPDGRKYLCPPPGFFDALTDFPDYDDLPLKHKTVEHKAHKHLICLPQREELERNKLFARHTKELEDFYAELPEQWDPDTVEYAVSSARPAESMCLLQSTKALLNTTKSTNPPMDLSSINTAIRALVPTNTPSDDKLSLNELTLRLGAVAVSLRSSMVEENEALRFRQLKERNYLHKMLKEELGGMDRVPGMPPREVRDVGLRRQGVEQQPIAPPAPAGQQSAANPESHDSAPVAPGPVQGLRLDTTAPPSSIPLKRGISPSVANAPRIPPALRTLDPAHSPVHRVSEPEEMDATRAGDAEMTDVRIVDAPLKDTLPVAPVAQLERERERVSVALTSPAGKARAPASRADSFQPVTSARHASPPEFSSSHRGVPPLSRRSGPSPDQTFIAPRGPRRSGREDLPDRLNHGRDLNGPGSGRHDSLWNKPPYMADRSLRDRERLLTSKGKGPTSEHPLEFPGYACEHYRNHGSCRHIEKCGPALKIEKEERSTNPQYSYGDVPDMHPSRERHFQEEYHSERLARAEGGAGGRATLNQSDPIPEVSKSHADEESRRQTPREGCEVDLWSVFNRINIIEDQRAVILPLVGAQVELFAQGKVPFASVIREAFNALPFPANSHPVDFKEISEFMTWVNLPTTIPFVQAVGMAMGPLLLAGKLSLRGASSVMANVHKLCVEIQEQGGALPSVEEMRPRTIMGGAVEVKSYQKARDPRLNR
ncbi:hypothetical protein YB2330_002029 [Saitoella coloradoensis]